MANPQLENGFSRIENELLEEFAKTKLSNYETRVLIFIIRQTYGFSRNFAKTSLSEISEGTQILKPAACKALKSLIEKNIILDRGETENYKRIYKFNKDYDTWQT